MKPTVEYRKKAKPKWVVKVDASVPGYSKFDEKSAVSRLASLQAKHAARMRRYRAKLKAKKAK